MKNYTAPWSILLKVVSLCATAICVGASIFLIRRPDPGIVGSIYAWTGFALPALVVGAALFVVRGYAITPEAILVRRLFWITRIPRFGLQSAIFAPGAMRGSIRLWGNGGFFSFTGWFWNQSLRTYRAYVTDGQRTVVLHFEKRTVVLSPGSPEEFIRELS